MFIWFLLKTWSYSASESFKKKKKNYCIHLANAGLHRIGEGKQKESCFNIWYKEKQPFCPKIVLLNVRPGCKADI